MNKTRNLINNLNSWKNRLIPYKHIPKYQIMSWMSCRILVCTKFQSGGCSQFWIVFFLQFCCFSYGMVNFHQEILTLFSTRDSKPYSNRPVIMEICHSWLIWAEAHHWFPEFSDVRRPQRYVKLITLLYQYIQGKAFALFSTKKKSETDRFLLESNKLCKMRGCLLWFKIPFFFWWLCLASLQDWYHSYQQSMGGWLWV